jgi:hypothetical protein
MSHDAHPTPANCLKPRNQRSKRRQPPPLMVRAPEAARLCGTSEASWWRWNAGGLCPAGLRVAGQRLWSRRSLLLWIGWGCPPRVEYEARLAAQRNGRGARPGRGS